MSIMIMIKTGPAWLLSTTILTEVRSAQNKPGDPKAIRVGQVMMGGPGSTSVLLSLSCTAQNHLES